MITEPTSEQLAQIRKAVSDNNGRFYVDFSDEIGNNIYSVYYNNASPSRVSNDIRRYYQEGIKPQGDGFNDYQEDRMYSIALDDGPNSDHCKT